MSLVVVNADITSTLPRRRTLDTLAHQLASHTVAISFFTYGELTKWTLVRRWGPRGPDTMRTFLDCGSLDADEPQIRPADELDCWEWVDLAQLDDYVIDFISNRDEQPLRRRPSHTLSTGA